MSRFVFTSFLVGVGTSCYISLAVNERLYDRRVMLSPKANADELVEAYYQQVCCGYDTFKLNFIITEYI